MILLKKHYQIAIFAFFALFSMAQAQEKMMAIIDIQLVGDSKKYFSAEERQYLSTAIRSQASQILGGQIEILSQANFKKLVKANAEGCSEAGCFAGFIAEIGVDLGMQPTISYAFGKLKMTLEVADNRATISSRTLSVEPTEEGKNLLGEQAEIAAKELFMEIATKLGTFNTAPQVERNSDKTDVNTDLSSSNSDAKDQNTSTIQDLKANENMTYDYEISHDQASAKSNKKTDPEIDHSGFRQSLRGTIGFASLSEGILGARYGVSLNGFGIYVGYGALAILLLDVKNHLTFTPVFGLGYKKNRTEFSIQYELIDETYYDEYGNQSYDSFSIYQLQVFRDFGSPKGFGLYFGLGYIKYDYSDNSEPEPVVLPIINVAVSYEFL